MKERLVIGSRGSDLALWQANFVKRQLEEAIPECEFEIRIITTTGDRLLDVALSKIGDKGLFTQQIETELLNGSIDFAVHSLKDLQTSQTQGLTIGAVCKRERANDVLIARDCSSIADLPPKAKVATGSLRRKSQLLNYRPDLDVVEIRGNVPTRLKKFDESGIDAIVLAYAGLKRLGLDHRISHVIPSDLMVPAVGQGAVAVETRADDTRVLDLAAMLDDPETRASTTAERAFLRRLEGGCQAPIGGFATIANNRIVLQGVVGTLDGSIVMRETIEGEVEAAEDIGVRLADLMIDNGASELLSRVRNELGMSADAVL